MKILTTFLLLLSLSVLGQQKIDYKKEMIASGEHQIPSQVLKFQTDFEAFLKAKAWQRSAASIFSNTKDLDITGIGGRVRASLVDATHHIALVSP